MGGGASKSPFVAVAAARELTRSADDGRVVHIVGTVEAANGDVLSSPFGGSRGPAVRVLTKRQDGTTAGSVAQSALDFWVASGSARVRVLVPQADAWAWHLRQTNCTHNLMVDEAGLNFVGGGKKHYYNELKPLPDGMEFWETLISPYEPVSMIQKFGGPRGDDVQKPRMAIEQTLRIGDPVAVVGVLGQTEAGELTISPQLPKGKGQISNDPRVAASLNGVQSRRRPSKEELADEQLRVIPLARHKKAQAAARTGAKW